MSATDDRDVKLNLARQKLTKFRKKKASTPAADHSDTGSIPGSVSEIADDFSGRSSPSHESLRPLPDRVSQALLGENPLLNFDNAGSYSKSMYIDDYSVHNRGSDGHATAGAFGEEYGSKRSESFLDNQAATTNGDIMRNHTEKPAVPAKSSLSISESSHDKKTSPMRSISSQSTENDSDPRLKRQLAELMESNYKLKYDLDRERNSVESRILQEHQSLREQLNGHIQTIGILVAEKTELQAAVTQADYIAKKKATEAEGLATKLAELHRRVAEYEHRLNDRTSSGQHQLESYQESYNMQSAQLAELKQKNENLERNADQLREELFELRKKLNLKDNEVRTLEERTEQLELRLSRKTDQHLLQSGQDTHGNEQLDALMRDKKLLESRLKEYQTELISLKQDMNETVNRYQSLLTQVNSARDRKIDVGGLEARVMELEAAHQMLKQQLESVQQERDEGLSTISLHVDTINELNQQLAMAQQNVQQKTLENEVMMSELKQLEQELVSLRIANEQAHAAVSDRQNLLSSVESDKIALSRAMTQNYELKSLLDQLTVELEREKQEIFRHKGDPGSTPVNGLVPSEAPVVVSSESQTSLQGPPDTVPVVSANQKAYEGKIRNLEDEIQMYKNRVVQADSEVIYLKNALRIKEEEAKLLDLTERVGAYRTLEHKFVTSMKQNAELQDQVEQLEHIIMQLQGETETIGDYIALYQNQRGLQKQREHEKDVQIERLLREREILNTKISQLVNYVKTNLGMTSSHVHKPVHQEMPLSGDVPDAHVETVPEENGERLEEKVTTFDADSLSQIKQQESIADLVQDLDTLLQKDAAEAISQSPLPGHPLYCRCCVGDLKLV